MSFFQRILPSVSGYVAAWLTLVLVGIPVCTQFILSGLSALGADVSLTLRITSSFQDIFGMLFAASVPVINFGVIFGIGLLMAMGAARLCVRLGLPMPRIVFAAAGLVSVIAILSLMDLLVVDLGITPIAATRSTGGTIALCLVGGLSGYVFIRVRDMMREH